MFIFHTVKFKAVINFNEEGKKIEEFKHDQVNNKKKEERESKRIYDANVFMFTLS